MSVFKTGVTEALRDLPPCSGSDRAACCQSSFLTAEHELSMVLLNIAEIERRARSTEGSNREYSEIAGH